MPVVLGSVVVDWAFGATEEEVDHFRRQELGIVDVSPQVLNIAEDQIGFGERSSGIGWLGRAQIVQIAARQEFRPRRAAYGRVRKPVGREGTLGSHESVCLPERLPSTECIILVVVEDEDEVWARGVGQQQCRW